MQSLSTIICVINQMHKMIMITVQKCSSTFYTRREKVTASRTTQKCACCLHSCMTLNEIARLKYVQDEICTCLIRYSLIALAVSYRKSKIMFR